MSLYPLWKNTNKTEFSSVFSVPPGQVCVLFASGLQKYKYRVDASEVQVPQVFCVRRLLHNFTFPVDKANLPCGWIFDTEKSGADEIIDEIVRSCSDPWQLSMCSNLRVIGVPGTYRLELNDTTAIGKAQVFAELYNAKTFPMQVKDLFFL